MPLDQDNTFKTWREANLASLKNEPFLFRIKINLFNLYYLLKTPRKQLSIIKMAKNAQPVIFNNTPTVFIANKLDPWVVSDKLDFYVSKNNWTFIGFKGDHNDIWENSDNYIGIIKRYGKLLV